jgi:hypothetical protein
LRELDLAEDVELLVGDRGEDLVVLLEATISHDRLPQDSYGLEKAMSHPTLGQAKTKRYFALTRRGPHPYEDVYVDRLENRLVVGIANEGEVST